MSAGGSSDYFRPTVSFKSVYFRDNVANKGGVAYVAFGANTLFESCRFSGNRGGGGVSVFFPFSFVFKFLLSFWC